MSEPYPHGLIQTIRGMCTDERPYPEIDQALVRLDDLLSPQPSVQVTDEMANAAWDAYSEARDNGEDEPVVVMRAALEAALSHEHDWKPVGLDSWRCDCGDETMSPDTRNIYRAASLDVVGDCAGTRKISTASHVRLGNWNDRHCPHDTRSAASLRWRLIDAFCSWLYVKGDPK